MAKNKFVGDDEEAKAYGVIKAEDVEQPDEADEGGDDEEGDDPEAAEEKFLQWADTMDERDAELAKQRKDASERDRILAAHGSTAGKQSRDEVRKLLGRVRDLRTKAEETPDDAEVTKELAAAERDLRKMRASARGAEAAGMPKPRERDRQAMLVDLASRGVDITASPDEGPPLMERSDSYLDEYLRATNGD